MGVYVHLHVCFSADSNDGIAALAVKHLGLLAEAEAGGGLRDDGDERIDWLEARWFLQSLAARTGPNPGPKGGLSLWGTIGNYTIPEDFVAVLRPFWAELLTGEIEGGPCAHHHVIVLYEREQSERAGAFEVSRDERTAELLVHHHEDLPFCWNQM